jgi:hypothetical protein
MKPIIIAILAIALSFTGARALALIPMDDAQADHLKAYGLVFHALQSGSKVFWLLNYRGGSFAAPESDRLFLEAGEEGVTIGRISSSEWAEILRTIEENNMDKITLEKAPKIAVYTPPEKLPWDDAVTLALAYAKIPYDKIYDTGVLTGKLATYDWLHLHHEDFTGQYSKFYAAFGSAPWYQREKMGLEKIAHDCGFKKVSDCKKAVSLAIRKYVENGGFLFAMCSATNTLEIALAALGADVVDKIYDNDGIDPNYQAKLDFSNCMAFENFTIQTNPLAGNFDNIDVNQVNTPLRIPPGDFELFDFSAKLDPVPTMLTQDHERVIKGYFGLLTSFNKNVVKKNVTVLANVPGTIMVNYLHGVIGKGQFAFLGGHDPEDYSHAVGDKPTILEFHKHSPGYRLILNNVLFPAAEKKEKKT